MQNCQYGVLMELKAVGQVDQHFVGNPQHSVFKKQIKQHHNFAIDWDVRSQFEGQGTRFSAEIPIKGDICIGAMIDMGEDTNIVPRSYTIKIGGLVIQEHTIDQKQARLEHLNHREALHMAKRDAAGQTTSQYFFLTDVFFSKKGCGMVLPKSSLQDIVVELDFDSAPTTKEMYLQTFQVYFDDSSLLDTPHDIPITQVQSLSHTSKANEKCTIPLHFNLPIRVLRMVGGNHYALNVNGQTRFSMNEKQLHYISRYVDGRDLYTTTNEDKDKAVHYYFGIPDEDFSGSFNMSKCDRVELIVTCKNDDGIHLHAENYNILRYQNGRYSLMYTD